MIIGVLSDTHSLVLPPRMLEAFKSVDLIIHAGDLCDEGVLRTLKAIKPVRAVQGNVDDAALRKKLPLRELFEAEGVKIGVYHGHGPGKNALENTQAQFKNDKVDIVIYGHSHKPMNEKIGPTIFFNPGSPNDAVRAPYFSYGRLEVSKGRLKASIVKL